MDVQRGDNKDIDRIIRRKVSRIQPEFRPGSWDKLAQRLDAVEEDDAFDAEISGRLQRMRVPYQKSSWAALAARLELERRRIQAVVHYKVMELSLLLLLFMTAWHFIPTERQLPPTLPAGIPIAALESDNNNTTTAGTADFNNASNPSAQADYSNNANGISQEDISADLMTEGSNAVAVSKPSSSHQTISNQAWYSVTTEQDPVMPIASATSDGVTHAGDDAQVQLKTFRAQKAERLVSPSDAFASNGALTALEGETPLLDYGDPDELLDFIRPIERQTHIRIGFVGSPDYNRVITPSQDVGDGTVAPPLDRYSLGYGGGITIGVEHGRWEIETGALYSARRYQAIPTVYISGNLREGYSGIGLTDFELNTVSAPLNFRYNFVLHDKWRLYAQGGASLNIVLGANYYLADQAEIAGIQQNTGNGNNGTSAVEKPAALRAKSLTAGWLEGGSFWDNSTLYGDFGVGLERYMSPNWSMFVQPTYRHALPLFNEGLGPYQDRIHNFGIGMGLKVRL